MLSLAAAALALNVGVNTALPTARMPVVSMLANGNREPFAPLPASACMAGCTPVYVGVSRKHEGGSRLETEPVRRSFQSQFVYDSGPRTTIGESIGKTEFAGKVVPTGAASRLMQPMNYN